MCTLPRKYWILRIFSNLKRRVFLSLLVFHCVFLSHWQKYRNASLILSLDPKTCFSYFSPFFLHSLGRLVLAAVFSSDWRTIGEETIFKTSATLLEDNYWGQFKKRTIHWFVTCCSKQFRWRSIREKCPLCSLYSSAGLEKLKSVVSGWVRSGFNWDNVVWRESLWKRV